MSSVDDWKAKARATLAKLQACDPEDPPEGFSQEEWAGLIERQMAGCQRLLDASMDAPPSPAAQEAASVQLDALMVELDREFPVDGTLTDPGTGHA